MRDIDHFFPPSAQEAVRKQKERFLAGLKVDRGIVREEILESWLRSKNYKVNPENFNPVVVSEDSWLTMVESEAILWETTCRMIDKLVGDFLSESISHLNIFFANGHGVILKIWKGAGVKTVPNAPERLLRREELQGTGALPLCLLMGGFSSVSGHESWVFGGCQRVSLAMPINDYAGNISGAIVFSIPYPEFQESHLPLLKLTAFSIQEEMRLKKAGTRPADHNQIHAISARPSPAIKVDARRAHRAVFSFTDIIGKSQALLNVLKKAEKAAASDITTLIYGESGTGKELLAHAIHKAGKRNSAPFIAINCGALPPTLAEAELFGYVEGSFTGASKSGRIGKFELAHGGTIFLDEIGELPLAAQTLLLRFLQNKEITRIGGTSPKTVDVRVIAATNRNLEIGIKEKTFRLDLYYRLNALTLTLPSLRERLDDLENLAYSMCRRIAAKYEKNRLFHPSVLDILRRHLWPGNLRELENVVHHAVCMSENEMIIPSDLPDYLFQNHQRHADDEKKDLIRAKIVDVLIEAAGDVGAAAMLLGISRSGLYRKLKTLCIDPGYYRYMKKFLKTTSTEKNEHKPC